MKAQRGFTLIEIMIVVVVAAILASIAYPNYVSSVRKARRTEAKADIARLQILQEKFRSNNAAYASDVPTLIASGISSNYYTFTTTAVVGSESLSYNVVAAAKNSQANDSEKGVNCANLTLSVTSGNESYQPVECW